MEEIVETKEEAPGRDAEGSRLSLPLRVLGGGDPGGWAVGFGATPRGLSFGSCQGPTSPRPGHGLPSLHSSGEKRENQIKFLSAPPALRALGECPRENPEPLQLTVDVGYFRRFLCHRAGDAARFKPVLLQRFLLPAAGRPPSTQEDIGAKWTVMSADTDVQKAAWVLFLEHPRDMIHLKSISPR